jgi:hypothetical protein
MRFFIEGGGTLYGTGTKNEWPFSRGLSTTSGQRLSATYTAVMCGKNKRIIRGNRADGY